MKTSSTNFTLALLALGLGSVFLLTSCNKDNSATEGEPKGDWGFEFTLTDSSGTLLFDSISEFRSDSSYDFDPYFVDRMGQKFEIPIYEVKKYSALNFVASKSSSGIQEELNLHQDSILRWYLHLTDHHVDTIIVQRPIHGTSNNAGLIILNNDTLHKNGTHLDSSSHPYFKIVYP